MKTNESLFHDFWESPVGPLVGVATSRGLREIRWGKRAPAGSALSARHPVLMRAQVQLREYFGGKRRDFDLPLDPAGTEFQRAAWKALATIPYGRTVCYEEQALKLGRPKSARAVGAANGRNPLPIVVPCHRVIGKSGKLTGFAGGLEAKRVLLELERAWYSGK